MSNSVIIAGTCVIAFEGCLPFAFTAIEGCLPFAFTACEGCFPFIFIALVAFMAFEGCCPFIVIALVAFMAFIGCLFCWAVVAFIERLSNASRTAELNLGA